MTKRTPTKPTDKPAKTRTAGKLRSADTDKLPYVERDISWMHFNHRILAEARREDVPLLERVSFLGIYSNNLDEFFRVRVATLSRLAQCKASSMKADSQAAAATLKKVSRLNAEFAEEYSGTIQEVIQKLAEQGIVVVNQEELDDTQAHFVRCYYRERLSGFISPVWLDAIGHLSNEASDDTVHLAVRLRRKTAKRFSNALIPLPVRECGRFLRLPDRDGKKYLMYMDDVVRFCLPMIFSDQPYQDFSAHSFKFTKDAEMEFENDLQGGPLQKIAKGVSSRKHGEALRLIYDKQMPKDLLKLLQKKLDLSPADTIMPGGRYQNHRDLMSLPDCGRDDLKYPRWPSLIKPELTDGESLLRLVQKRDRFIHVPYHHFDFYIRLLQEAAISREVTSIQTTLYRLARDSKVVKALMTAAANGKKVTVVIELMARFDEASNIDWSHKMKEAGIKVAFGVEGLKIHSKITHIGMKKSPDVAVISTGNFHEGNARSYTDYMVMTSRPSLVRDVEKVFSFIARPYAPIKFKELLVSPNQMKTTFLRLIDDEIRNHASGRGAYIKVKINHITEPDMVKALYRASQAGVKVDLLVRGNCSLVPGVEGVSDNITCRGIIDRYLEHSRVFIFCANGENKTFIGSADWMPRNLLSRIEVVAPVYDPDIKADLWEVVQSGLRDNLHAHPVGQSDAAIASTPGGEPPFRSQEALYQHYRQLQPTNGHE